MKDKIGQKLAVHDRVATTLYGALCVGVITKLTKAYVYVLALDETAMLATFKTTSSNVIKIGNTE